MPHKDVLGQKYVLTIITEPEDSPAQLFQTIIFVHGAQISTKKSIWKFQEGFISSESYSDKNSHAVCYRLLGLVCCMTKIIVSQRILADVDTPFLV